MKNNFDLTICRKKTIRRRTLCGRTVWYYTFFEPKGLDKHQRRIAIDSFKHPITKEDETTSNSMIEYSLNEFLKNHSIHEFDTILGMASSSKIVKKIINSFLNVGFKGRVIYKGFEKTRMRNTVLKTDLVDREGSQKTKEKVPKSFSQSKKLHYDKVSKSSLFPTRFRRYIGNLLKLNWNRGSGNVSGIQSSSDINGKKILVVDDTFGEGLTMCEAFDVLTPYTKNVIGFTVMKDMSQKRGVY